MIKFEYFNENHLSDYIYNGVEKWNQAEFKECFSNVLKISKAIKTIFIDSQVKGFIGIHEVNPDTATIWAFMNEDLYKYKIGFCKSLWAELFELKYHRLQVICYESLEKANRFVEYFGFKKEGILRQFENKKDCVIYSRIKGDI